MKFRMFVIIAIVSFLAGITIAAENNPPGTPSLSVPQPLYTFESVVDGTQVIHDFDIQNKGSETLEIKKVKTD